MKRTVSLNLQDQITLDRRRALKSLGQAAVISLVSDLGGATAFAETKQPPMNRFPRMVHEFFVTQVRKAETDVHLVGLGWGTLPATFAALLSNSVKQITLKGALNSYSQIAENEHYDWPLSTLLPDVLKHFDLPDCYAELSSKELKQIEPKGART